MFRKRVSISFIAVGHVAKQLGLDVGAVFGWNRGDDRHKHRRVKIHRLGMPKRLDSNY
ncbi:MAG: hypothetical protein HN929_13430 [Chloroflexi bacterium]|jgi:hypothetical protein|nr:hypothetical protein [Chloroflexota bacterium]MBT7082441.1 hypothetical protein [Chloroflexota bacterium]MBT7290024.1 hypothetical protein [Chloroflexota bacterium]